MVPIMMAAIMTMTPTMANYAWPGRQLLLLLLSLLLLWHVNWNNR